MPHEKPIRLRPRALVVLAILLAAGIAGASAQSPALLFRNGRVFDGQAVHTATDVLVQAGRIAGMGRNLSAPAGAQIIDATGMTLLPGFIDAHTHAWADALREAVMFGVTTELDMFSSDPQLSRTLRAEQQADKASARADLFTAGILVTAPRGHGTEYGAVIPTLTAPESAQAFVDARIAEGSDYIKIVYDDGLVYGLSWPTLTRETMRATVQAAHKRGKLAVVHVGSAAGARAALEAGADGLVHLFTDAAPAADFEALARQRGAFVIPTLVVLQSIAGQSVATALIKDERLGKYLAPVSRSMLVGAFPIQPGSPKRSFDVAAQTVRRLAQAGVPILAGTDAPNPGTAHGVSLHSELELLVQAGLSNAQALAAATSVPARAFRLNDRGRIATGLRADIVLVKGDPLSDITATRAIEGVWKGGIPVDRAAFARTVASALAEAAAPLKQHAAGPVSDFEGGKAAAQFGTDWIVSTDSYAGGKSTVELKIGAGGAENSLGSLHLTGTISAAVPYAWAGAMWSPGAQPMQPANLSASKELVFWARGDGKTYRAMVFAQSKGMTPLSQTFVAGAEWREVVIPWSAFGIDARDLMAVIVTGGPAPGPFSVQVDQVRVR